MNWVCENSWEAYYELAKVYYFENKHLDIPENYVTSSGHKLGQWLARQKTTPLSEEKELLSLIGMDFTCDSDKQWLEGYQHASNYFKTEQNLLVHGRYECDDGFKLGIWISSQRSKYKNNQLTANQIQLLEEIQMVFDPLEMKWNQNYAQAEIYKNKHGNLKIPVTFKTKDGFRLGAWLNAQKKAYQKQKGYSEDHFMKLTKLGMEW